MVGRFLGASSVHDARAVGRRLIELGVVVGLAVRARGRRGRDPWLAEPLHHRSRRAPPHPQVLWIVAALQPLAAVVFVLDGVLIGAGDAGYLALAMLVATVGVYLPAALLVAVLDGGLLWLWGALVALDAGPVRRHGGPLPHDALGGRGRDPLPVTRARFASTAAERLSWAHARIAGTAAAPRRPRIDHPAGPIAGRGARRRRAARRAPGGSTAGAAARRSARSPARCTTRSTATGCAPSGRDSSTCRSTAARCSSPTTAARSRRTRPW